MPEEYELLISEKPKVSLRIAEALADGPVRKETYKKVSYYILTRGGKKIVVAPAVGHLFTLKQDAGAYGYPIFDIKWIPSYEASKTSLFTKDYVNCLKKLAKGAASYVNACDFDIEGSLIGYNALKFICGEKSTENAKRMRFSALTKQELTKAYENKDPQLDFSMVNAGITRHMLDWYWGINTSRALSYAYKAVSGRYMTLSAGRVQTPTLRVLYDREKKIQDFKPTPYWEITAILSKNNFDFTAIHKTEKFLDSKEAENTHKRCKNQNGAVKKLQKRKFEQKAPFPFNLGDLQSETYKLFKYSPKMTQALAQSLYEQGLISYPRTSSQKLPQGVSPKDLLKKIGSIKKYTNLIADVLSLPKLKPNEGSKTDPAHPCIYPTGEQPKKLTKPEENLLDLVVKRFCACFGDPAVRETVTVEIEISGEPFVASGTRTVEKNWHLLYAPYVKLKEESLPELKEGEQLDVKSLDLAEKETQPPSRFSQAGIIKKMEQIGIGTKATRANILQTLYDRNYIAGTQIEVTGLGGTIVKTLVTYVPELTSEELTHRFEEDMKKIQEGKLQKDSVIEDAKKELKKLTEKFKAHEGEIGKKLTESYFSTAKTQNTIGVCPKCGADLIIRVSKRTGKQFVGCSAYPKCDAGYPLPQNAQIIKTEKKCEHDGLPIIEVRRRGKRRFTMCIDPKCPSKASWGKAKSK